ncbi:putative disease resistance RPP13-like protein 1 isoform X2 [Vitis riparia]|uniref:putative disease resistance RPP13-like protein 1 isoform X2 n=1 Tax=Vitis riparia TaxID=96939 RepID=UPI00155A99D4|nr:putative disease resistance RPP13-like protein 1 isoform X2 [Vitis riparia]
MAGFVGEAVLSGLIQKLIDMVTSPELWNFASEEHVHSELNKWNKILTKIYAVLHDAEEKHMTDPLVKMWLDELGDLAYDVEDILDSFATEALRRNLMAETLPSGTQPSTSKLRSLIPSCCTSFTPNSIKFNAEMWSKIKKITAGLQEISAQKNDLHLTENIAGKRSTKTREILPTTSLVDESRVYGRETDKAAIANLLLRDDPCTDEVCVIPVVGMAGIGKTTLAQLAFNDDEVKAHFDLRVWVYVSDDFDVLKITKTILQSVSPNTHDVNDLNLLQMTLREDLSGKKFLLILDDVWNENLDSWDFLCMPMRSGAPGSKLIVTTRNEGVVSITRTLPAYRLQELAYEDCLSVFTQQALRKSNFDGHSHLKEVGEEIVRKCKGMPLAAKALGGMLRNQVSLDAWENILTGKIWDLPEDKSGVLPALKLSYYRLPSHLKKCFAYCSIFPKGYEFDKDELIQLWMAEGFLQQTKENTWPEDLGSKYFYDLLSRSFFQQSNHNSSRFVMHDLINDLAQYVAGELCFNLEGILVNNNQSTTFKKARHSSFNRKEYEMLEKFNAFHEMSCLRTLVALPLNAFSRYHFIPSKTLILSDCWRLTKLPVVIGRLINLRHIDISGTSQLQEMPSKISNLTNLQTLSKYIVGENNSSRIRELKNLKNLRGKLSISGLHNVVDSRDAMDAKLEEKHSIEELIMEWGSDFGNSRNEMNEINVLAGLRPPRNLKNLTVAFYGGSTFLGWIRDPSFPSMTQLILKNCKRCTSLPSLGKLPLLKTLHIEGMGDIRNIDVEFYGEVVQPFPSLEFLKFENMPKWENWFFPDAVEGVELFPRLRELTIRNCSKLVKQLPDCLPSLVKLDISKCRNLAVSFSRFASLGELKIEECKEMVLRNGVVADSGDQLTSRWVCSGLESAVIGRCDWLVSLDDQRLPCNLKMLKIADCVNLKSLQNGLQNLTCLEELEMVGCLAVESLPETPPMLRRLVLQKCRSLRSLPHNYSSCPLESLEIRCCPSLICFPHGGLPSTLKQLTVADCIRLKYLPDGMMHRNSTHSNNACCLQMLRIHDCKSLKFFPRGELPPTLKRLEIRHCSNLESVSEKMWPKNTALEYLEMRGYPNLKILPECLHSVKQLKIGDCGGLEGFPERGFSAPNLRELRIWRCENLKFLPHQMKNLTSLQVLSVENSPGLESFPEGGLAPSLKFLSIINCKNLKTPISEWGLHTLTALSTLKIWEMFPGKASLWDNKCLFPTSLTNLHINHMESLTSLELKNIISLQHLYIGCCPKLRSLRLRPIALSSLEIIGCPLLQETKFPSIAHIPKFKIDGRVNYSTGGGNRMETESRSTLSFHCSIRDPA